MSISNLGPKYNVSDRWVTIIVTYLNDIASNQRSATDPTQKEHIPDGDSGSSLMNEVHIRNGTLDEDFVRSHTDSAIDTGCQEARVIFRHSSPDTAGKHDDTRDRIDRPSSEFLRYRIEYEKRQADQQYHPRRSL